MCHAFDVLFTFFFKDTATTEIYTLSLPAALPISSSTLQLRSRPSTTPVTCTSDPAGKACSTERASTRSEEHTSNSSHVRISYAVFCLKKKKNAPCHAANHCRDGERHSRALLSTTP